MATSLQFRLRAFLGLLLGLAFCHSPLQAQLDPRLQGASTDFLDLYQQSTATRVKPEIVTVFDFSGSMSGIMYSSRYNNTHTTDPSTANMTFALTGSNTYTISAVSNARTNEWSSLDASVNGGVGNLQSQHGSGTYEISNMTTSATTIAPGGSYTFFSSITSGSDKGVNWSCTGGYFSSTSNTQAVWVAPAALTPSVSASLNFGTPVGTLTSSQFITPSGNTVDEALVNTTNTGSGLLGAGFKAADIRNWVRAASHVRFQYTNGSDLRTVDVPIPWKIMDGTSTGTPLSSMTVLDHGSILNPNGTTTTFGSNTQIEMDRSYRIGGNVISGNASQQTTCTLSVCDYLQPYARWLLTGKYQNTDNTRPDYNATYSGKYIVYDANNASLAGGQGNVNWGKGFGTFLAGDTVQVYNLVTKTTSAQHASANVIPNRTRTQAVKESAIRTWINYQTRVFWAFRFLDNGTGESGSGTATDINNNSRASINGTDATANYVSGSDTGWTLLNNNSINGMARIASVFADTCTPLTYAMARGMAQFNDPSSVFNDVQNGADAPLQCQTHFLILFTDGQDNNACYGNSTTATPYLSGNTGNAEAGNAALIANTTSVDRWGSWWNLFTFAGVAAHAGDSSKTHYTDDTPITSFITPSGTYPPTTSATPSSFLPFTVTKRGAITYDDPHMIATMTVGVSLGGSYTNTAGPKYRMFTAAAIGDPNRTSWDLTALKPFQLLDEAHPEYGKTADSVNFFDASDPASLTRSLDAAFQAALSSSNINATANPNVPYIGASFSKQIYLGKFQPPEKGGVVWPGDLLMFATKQLGDTIVPIDSTGNAATTIDKSTAQWAASDALVTGHRLWSGRNLFTRIPGTATTPEPGLKPFTDQGVNFTNLTNGLKNFVALSLPADAQKQVVIQFAAGGDTSKITPPTRPTTNRDNIMGDVINSSPAVIEYLWDDVASSLSAYSGFASIPNTGTRHFRVILAGTNQGWLHAFGEVTWDVETPVGSGKYVTHGAVDELWSFMPTDFLANLSHITVAGNAHRFMVDGTPTIYHLDRPASTGGLGNGVVDISGTPERTLAIFGLRKGGRSYYALDIHNPFSPAVKWSLVPDEAAFFSSSRILPAGSGAPDLATVKGVVAKMGYSSCTPTFGRILFNGVYRDAVFLGGGHSTASADTAFAAKLGRSVMALDVYTGEVLAAADMTHPNIGGAGVAPISRGLVPMEFFLGSGMTQRTYFLDARGGLWAWGSKELATTAPYANYRKDTSDLARWTTTGSAGAAPGIRRVYQDKSGLVDSTTHNQNAVYTTLPAPFLVGSFPGKGKTTGSASPVAVGVAIVSGDRNNPLDYPSEASPLPSRHRLTVVFDRQDSHEWGLDTQSGPDTGVIGDDSATGGNLIDFTGNVVATNPTSACSEAIWKYITPGCSDYYLAPTAGTPYFGYYAHFPVASNGFVPKGIISPMVVSGSLYYSYFSPDDADPCTGGSGTTHSMIVCDVINPLIEDKRPNIACKSGEVFEWVGVASDYIAVGTRGVLQAGAVSAPVIVSGSKTTPEIHNFLGQPQALYPKARVWRTVH